MFDYLPPQSPERISPRLGRVRLADSLLLGVLNLGLAVGSLFLFILYVDKPIMDWLPMQIAISSYVAAPFLFLLNVLYSYRDARCGLRCQAILVLAPGSDWSTSAARNWSMGGGREGRSALGQH